MPDTDRPRNSIEALIDRSFLRDDSGGRGLGPTLGVQPADPDPEPLRDDVEPYPDDVDDKQPDLFAPSPGPHEHRLGSEAAAAGEDLGAAPLRGPHPPGEDELPPQAHADIARPGVAAPDVIRPAEAEAVRIAEQPTERRTGR